MKVRCVPIAKVFCSEIWLKCTATKSHNIFAIIIRMFIQAIVIWIFQYNKYSGENLIVFVQIFKEIFSDFIVIFPAFCGVSNRLKRVFLVHNFGCPSYYVTDCNNVAVDVKRSEANVTKIIIKTSSHSGELDTMGKYVFEWTRILQYVQFRTSIRFKWSRKHKWFETIE